jgi:hypothetical protein
MLSCFWWKKSRRNQQSQINQQKINQALHLESSPNNLSKEANHKDQEDIPNSSIKIENHNEHKDDESGEHEDEARTPSPCIRFEAIVISLVMTKNFV